MALKVGELYYDITADTGKLVQETRTVERETGSMIARFSAVAAAVKELAVAYVLLRMAQLAEDFRLLSSRVQIAAGSLEAGTAAMKALQSISTRTQTSLEANVQVFTRLNSSLLQMGGTQEDTLKLTEILGKAIKVSGANAAESASAMTQFGQALGSGKLAGDELRSLLETAPYLMKQLADGLGVPIGALKQLGEEGKLTADVVTEALGKAAAQIEADFQQMPQTMSGAMQVAMDAAQRLAEKLDDVSGTSAALTGVTTGLGRVMDALAASFTGASGEADKLGRSNTVQQWADGTAKVLSYVVDAADFVVRGFRQIGTAIGGTAAAVGALANGELRQARDIMAMMAKDVVAIGAGPLTGQTIRQRLAAGSQGGAASSAPFSKLKPPAMGGKTGGKSGKGGGAAFDSAGYLAGLERATLEGIALVDAAEQEALRKNAELAAEKKITAETAAQAVTLIERNAAQERAQIREREAQEVLEKARELAQEEERAAQQLAESRARGLQMAQDAAVINDPVAQLELRLARESELLTQYALQDIANAQIYAQAKVALEQETAQQIQEIRKRQVAQQAAINQQAVGLAQGLAGDLYGILEASGREQSALGKALFLTQKALAIAQIILNTEVAASRALAEGGAFLGIPLASLIRATGYASAGIAAGLAVGQVAGGRQYGGPVSAGSLYRVNETGRPEMFTAANGSQYMLPTADGNVTPANRIAQSGGGQVIHLVQNFNISSPTDPRSQQQVAGAAARGLRAAQRNT